MAYQNNHIVHTEKYLSIACSCIEMTKRTFWKGWIEQLGEIKNQFKRKQVEEDINRAKGVKTITEEKMNFYLDIVDEWVNTSSESLYLGCAKNKIGDLLLILYRYDTIYLIGETYRSVMYAPKIMFHRISDTHLHIDDVLTKSNNIGNGSVLMNALLKYAKENGIRVITGDLSSVDADHKDRRDYYYKKFGFEVSEKNIKKIIGKDERS